MNCRARDRRGVALILVLWLVVVLGAVAGAVVNSSRGGSQLLVNARARLVSRYAAESGVVAAAAVLRQRMGYAFSPAQQVLAMQATTDEITRLRDVDLGDARFTVQLTNLSGRLDLNEADPQAVVALLAQFTSADAAQALGDALLDWRDGDDLPRPQGAEKNAYQKAGSPYVPRNGPFTRWDEFLRVRGVTDALARAVAPYLTVNGDFPVDVNAAPEPVLAAIPGVGPGGARALIGRRSGGPFTSVSEVLRLLRTQGAGSSPGELPRLVVSPTRLLVISRGWMPGHRTVHEIQAVYAVSGRQVALQSWRGQDR